MVSFMYDDDESVTFRRGPSLWTVVVLSAVVSAMTSAGAFVALRALDKRGVLGDTVNVAVQVPDVTGMTADQARELLAARGFLLQIGGRRADAKAAAGVILEQAPLPGSAAASGAPITATVSTGALQLPDVAGLAVDAALAKLRSAGVAVDDIAQEPTPSDSVAAGQALGTAPPAGSGVGPTDAVKLLVSAGPAGSPVPKLVGLRLTKAKQTIKDAGFEFGGTRWGYSDNSDPGVVLKQTPDEGTLAAPGSKIDIVVNEPD